MKKVLGVVLLVVLLSGVVYGEGIDWFAVANYLYYANGSTKLQGSTSSSIGCFVQLLWVGPNGAIDPAYASGMGTGPTDDVVVHWFWVGAGSAFGEDGWFDGANIGDGGQIVQGRYYFARVWSAPSPDFSSGLVPTSLTNKYINSATWQYPKSDPIADQFEITYTGPLSTTLSPLPISEPAAIGLVLGGLGCVRLMRRRQAA